MHREFSFAIWIRHCRNESVPSTNKFLNITFKHLIKGKFATNSENMSQVPAKRGIVGTGEEQQIRNRRFRSIHRREGVSSAANTPSSRPQPQPIGRIEDNRELVYELKPTPFSSHLLLTGSLPQRSAGKRVLDVGCGNGYLGKILAERGFDVTGIEQSGGTDAEFPASVRLVEANLETGLPPLDGKFDFILCADILEHLRDPMRLLKQLKERLAPGGELIASLPNSGNLYFRLVILSGRFPQDDKGLFDRTHVRFYTWDGWHRLFEESGFRIEAVKSSCIPVGLAVPAMSESLPIRIAERISYEMAKVWKRLFAYQFVVTARVR